MMVRQCAWCRRVKVRRLWIMIPPIGPVTHGICPQCMEKVRAETGNLPLNVPASNWTEIRTGA